MEPEGIELNEIEAGPREPKAESPAWNPEWNELNEIKRQASLDNATFKTPMTWDSSMDRFMKGGPRQYFGIDPKNHSYETVHARFKLQYEAKEETPYTLFGETISRDFGNKQVYFMNNVKLVAKDIGPNQFVTLIEYKGKKVAEYREGEGYRLPGSLEFLLDGKEAQKQFGNTPLGKYRDYLQRTEPGLADVSSERLRELFDDNRQEQNWAHYERKGVENLEIFKSWVRRNFPYVVVASLVTGLVVGLRKTTRSATKAVAKKKKSIVKAIEKTPLRLIAKPIVKPLLETTQKVLETTSDNVWLYGVPVVLVGLFLWKKRKR